MTTVVEVEAPKHELLLPHVSDVGQQPPPREAAHDLKPDVHEVAVAAGRVVVVVDVEVLMPVISH